MSSGKLWAMGLKQSTDHQETLMQEMRAKHFRIMKSKKNFAGVFGVDISDFYNDIYIGFDVIKFDAWLRAKVEAYDEDKESMSEFLSRKYGEEVRKMVASFI